MTIRVLLADDHRLMREGVRALIEKLPGMEVVGEAGGGAAAVRLACELSPGIVLMDVSMPDMNGIEATRRITTKAPGVKVVALSMHSDRRLVAEMLRAGARGYLLKRCAAEELADALHAVMAGGTYVSSEAAGDAPVEDAAGLVAEEAEAPPLLTPRQREVLRLLAEDRTPQQIASKLNIDTEAVEEHRGQIMHKLDVDSVSGLKRYAAREGLIPPDDPPAPASERGD